MHAITITYDLPSKGKMTFVAAFLSSQFLPGDGTFDFFLNIFFFRHQKLYLSSVVHSPQNDVQFVL